MGLSKLNAVLRVAGIILAAIVVVVPALQKRTLEGRVEELTTRIRDPYPGFLVPPVVVQSLSGDSLSLGTAPPGHLQIVFVFATACDACLASLPAWKAIAAAVQSEPRIDVVGLAVDSADPTSEYVAEHRIEFPVATVIDLRTRALYRLRRIPQVMVLDAVGRVRYVRFGTLSDGPAVDSVRAALLDRLPLVTAAPVRTNVSDAAIRVPR